MSQVSLVSRRKGIVDLAGELVHHCDAAPRTLRIGQTDAARGEAPDGLRRDDVLADRLPTAEQDVELGAISIRREVLGRYGASEAMLAQVQTKISSSIGSIQVVVD